jgi:alkanesulfonate monooxygenase SsuD/methylene tetrahydromethanopterin reductase-like flavin-dependent oxidoreductase (luciferase family)
VPGNVRGRAVVQGERDTVRYGLYLPNFGAFGEARAVAELARDAEGAGWDGLFLWDHVARDCRTDVVDPWVALSAAAMVTRRLRLGALVTPLARRRPWKLARETVSLDRLSGGRLVFGAGLGSGAASEWERLGEETDPRVRAEKLDEGLAVLTGLWRGEPFGFDGRHHRVRDACFVPPPLQRPRPPVWIAGYWPNRAPLRRAARWDGMFPLFRETPPEDVRCLEAAVRYVRERRRDAGPFDVVHLSHAGPDADPARAVAPYAEAGATWWLERLTPDAFGSGWLETWPVARMHARVRAGPPRTGG